MQPVVRNIHVFLGGDGIAAPVDSVQKAGLRVDVYQSRKMQGFLAENPREDEIMHRRQPMNISTETEPLTKRTVGGKLSRRLL
jgi:hypothetical protein